MKQVFTNKNLRHLALVSFFYGITQSMFALRATFLTANGMSAAEVGVMFSITGILGSISPIVGGILADKFFTRYKVFIVALFSYALVVAFSPLSGTIRIGGTLAAMFLFPMMNLFNPPVSGMIQTCSINATNGLSGVDYSHLRLCMSSGYTIANIIMTPIIRAFGLNVPYYICLVFFVFVFLLRQSMKDNETDPTQDHVVDKKKLDVGAVFKSYYLVSFILLSVLYASSNCCANNISYLLQEVGLDSSNIGLVSGLKVVGEIVIMLVFPWFRKRISLSGCQMLAGLCLGVSTLLLVGANTLPEIIFYEMIGGLGNGIALVSAGHYLCAMVPFGLEATAISLWTVGTNVGSILLPLLFGEIIDRAGIIPCYKWSAAIEILWVLLFVGSLLFGKYVLRKRNVCGFLFNREPRGKRA